MGWAGKSAPDYLLAEVERREAPIVNVSLRFPGVKVGGGEHRVGFLYAGWRGSIG